MTYKMNVKYSIVFFLHLTRSFLSIKLIKLFKLVNIYYIYSTGDFDVPSSREDVDRDSSWNQWLRNEIPKLFVEALDNFKVC